MRKFWKTAFAMSLLTGGFLFSVWMGGDKELFQWFSITLGSYLGVFTYGNVQEHRCEVENARRNSS